MLRRSSIGNFHTISACKLASTTLSKKRRIIPIHPTTTLCLVPIGGKLPIFHGTAAHSHCNLPIKPTTSTTVLSMWASGIKTPAIFVKNTNSRGTRTTFRSAKSSVLKNGISNSRQKSTTCLTNNTT